MRFTWDEDKNHKNFNKHGIRFEDAIRIFDGTEEIQYDSDHSSSSEDRFIAYGKLPNYGSVIVVFVELIDDELRIISARRV